MEFCNFYRFRSGHKLSIDIPIWDASKTPHSGNPSNIHIDSSVMCMNHNDIQETFSSYNLEFVRYLTDQFFILGPLTMACSASSVIYDYKLADIDNHSFLVEQMFNDRTEEERDPSNSEYIPYNKFGPNCLFIADDVRNKTEFQDVPVNVD